MGAGKSTCLHALVEIAAELGESDVAKAGEQQGFGILKSLVERVVYRFLDQATWRLGAVAHGEERGFIEGEIDVVKGDGFQIATQFPAAAVAFLGADELVLAQTGEYPANHDRIGFHHFGQGVRGHRQANFGHVQEDVEHAR